MNVCYSSEPLGFRHIKATSNNQLVHGQVNVRQQQIQEAPPKVSVIANNVHKTVWIIGFKKKAKRVIEI